MNHTQMLTQAFDALEKYESPRTRAVGILSGRKVREMEKAGLAVVDKRELDRVIDDLETRIEEIDFMFADVDPRFKNSEEAKKQAYQYTINQLRMLL